MKYKEYNDFELISYVKEQIEEANEILIDKYMPLIIKTSKKIKDRVGIELSDIIQEGLLGLSKAIKTYNEDADTIFYTYAKRCIESSIYNLYKNMKRQKNIYLNESVSYDSEDNTLDNKLSNSINPLSSLIDEEDILSLHKKAKDILSDFEYDVFKLKIRGFDYKEIANCLNKTPKVIDNALLRIRKKLKK